MAAGRAPLTSLAGRTALLTGATGWLGASIAEAYCRAGARMLLSSRREGPLRQALARAPSARYSVDVSTPPCDLSQPDDVRRLADHGCRRFGGLDVLVNAAAVDTQPPRGLWRRPASR